MSFQGIIIGFFCLLAIGIAHPLVIKAEYWFSYKIWVAFLAAGLALAAVSVFTRGTVSIVFGVFSATLLWSIREVFQQRERVRKGWFPANPHRKDDPTREK